MEMTEILKLWKKIDHYYPRSQTVDMVEKFESWEEILLEQDAEQVFKNLREHVQISSFPPSLSQLINKPEQPRVVPDVEQTRRKLDAIPVKKVTAEEMIQLTPRMQRILRESGESNE